MCGYQAERVKTSRHIDNIFINNLKKTNKTGRNVRFKDILTSENPGNNLILIFKETRGERFRNTST